MAWVSKMMVGIWENGGDDRNRTCDILLAKQTLYQLSYIPTRSKTGGFTKRIVKGRQVPLTRFFLLGGWCG